MERIIGLLVVAFLTGPLARYSDWVGAVPQGNAYEDASPCTVPEALPAGALLVGGTDPSLPDFRATMDITLFPLGIVCTVHLADPTRAAVITHQSWPATMAWIGFSGIAVLATVLAILQGRRLHRGRLDPRVGC